MYTNLLIKPVLVFIALWLCLLSYGQSSYIDDPQPEDLKTLSVFYKKSIRWGLYGRVKNMDRKDYQQLIELHETYGLSTEYLTHTKRLTQTKTRWKERRKLNRNSFWDYELKPFLIRHQAIEYTPTKGARLDPGGTVRFQF